MSRFLKNAQGVQGPIPGTHDMWHCRAAQVKTNIPARSLMNEEKKKSRIEVKILHSFSVFIRKLANCLKLLCGT